MSTVSPALLRISAGHCVMRLPTPAPAWVREKKRKGGEEVQMMAETGPLPHTSSAWLGWELCCRWICCLLPGKRASKRVSMACQLSQNSVLTAHCQLRGKKLERLMPLPLFWSFHQAWAEKREETVHLWYPLWWAIKSKAKYSCDCKFCFSLSTRQVVFWALDKNVGLLADQ